MTTAMMNRMTRPLIKRLKGRGVALLMVMAASTVVVGCGGDAPVATDDRGGLFGAPQQMTILVSDPVDEQEAREVRVNIERNRSRPIVFEADDLEGVIEKEYPDGEIIGIHLDYDREKLRYECLVRSGGTVYIVIINPATGEVEEKKEATSYYYTAVITIVNIRVNVRDACDRAQDRIEGDVVEANIEEIEGRPTYVIVLITSDNRYITIYVDAETGKERKVKERKCDDDGNDDDEADDEGDDDSDEEISKGKKCKEKDKKRKGRGHHRHDEGKGHGHYFYCYCDCACDDDAGDGSGDDDDDDDDDDDSGDDEDDDDGDDDDDDDDDETGGDD